MNPKSLTLLAAIYAAGAAIFYATAADAAELLKAGYAEQNPGMADPANAKAFATRLTEAGVAEAAKLAPVAGAPASAPVTTGFAIEENIELPEAGLRSARTSKYPFDLLQPGNSFFIPGATMRNMASSISVANSKYAEPTGETKTVNETVYQLDAEGKRVTNADGTFIKTGTKTVQKPVTKQTREFVGQGRTENGVDGVRIWRKL